MKIVEENSSAWNHNDRNSCIGCRFILDYSLIIWLISYYHCIVIPHFVNMLSVNACAFSPFSYFTLFIVNIDSSVFHGSFISVHLSKNHHILRVAHHTFLSSRKWAFFHTLTKHKKGLQWITSIACFIVTTFAAWIIPFFLLNAYFGLQKNLKKVGRWVLKLDYRYRNKPRNNRLITPRIRCACEKLYPILYVSWEALNVAGIWKFNFCIRAVNSPTRMLIFVNKEKDEDETFIATLIRPYIT